MPTSNGDRPWRRVFHPTDFSRGSETAFFHALRLAASLDAELEIAHVFPKGRGRFFDQLPRVRETLQAWRESHCSGFPRARIKVRKTALPGERPGPSIRAYLADYPAEVLVLTTRQRKGWLRLKERPVAFPIAQCARRAALLLPRHAKGFVDSGRGSWRLDGLVAAIDHRPDPQVTIGRLLSFLRRLELRGVRCHLVHATNDGREAPEVRIPFPSAEAQWTYRVARGEPLGTVTRALREEDAGLLVLATEGRSGLGDSLLGSTSERILREVDRPVLLLPPLGS